MLLATAAFETTCGDAGPLDLLPFLVSFLLRQPRPTWVLLELALGCCALWTLGTLYGPGHLRALGTLYGMFHELPRATIQCVTQHLV